MLYVVDNRQGLHFQQVFAVMKLLGVDLELEHIGFGTVLGNDGKPLRTRDASGPVITVVSLLEESKQGLGIDSRCRDVSTDAIHGEHRKSEQHPPTQVGDVPDVLECADTHALPRQEPIFSDLPPAASIFFAAVPVKRCARTVSDTFSSPSPISST